MATQVYVTEMSQDESILVSIQLHLESIYSSVKLVSKTSPLVSDIHASLSHILKYAGTAIILF